MLVARPCHKLLRPALLKAAIHRPKSSVTRPIITDSYGIPLQPTWSVEDLLSSYPRPTISPATLSKLHALSALIPPAEGTPEHRALTIEMESLVKLVEAVKLVDTSDVNTPDGVQGTPDGRIWAEGIGIDLFEEADASSGVRSGQALLDHAARTANGLYVVDADKSK